MDSGNSGSLQSSSGAEEECNSRAVHQPHPPPPPPPFNHHQHMFDQNQINNHLLFTQQHQLVNNNNNNNLDSLIWSKTLPPFPTADQPTTTTTTKTPDPDRAPGRNPKKRSRASRRAPTTVLTTDTSNFRAMVQEFTGIPAPPFPSSSSNTFPPRFTSTTSFDLFGRSSMMMRSNPNTNTNTNTNNFDNYSLPQVAPIYPSFPQKLPTSLLDSTNLLTTMQMQNTIPSSSSLYLNHKLTPQNGFGVTGQTYGLHSTTLPDLVSTTTTTERNGDDQTASGKWNDGVNYGNEKGVDHHHHHGEPWVCSSD